MEGKKDGWMEEERIEGRVKGWLDDVHRDGQVDEWKDGWKGCMCGSVKGWMDGYMDVLIDGWMFEQVAERREG